MRKHSAYLASLTTPPAVILNIYSLIVENINVFLLIGVSAASLVFWVISIKNKRQEILKNKAEIAAMEAQERYYNLQCTRIDCELKKKV